LFYSFEPFNNRNEGKSKRFYDLSFSLYGVDTKRFVNALSVSIAQSWLLRNPAKRPYRSTTSEILIAGDAEFMKEAIYKYLKRNCGKFKAIKGTLLKGNINC